MNKLNYQEVGKIIAAYQQVLSGYSYLSTGFGTQFTPDQEQDQIFASAEINFVEGQIAKYQALQATLDPSATS